MPLPILWMQEQTLTPIIEGLYPYKFFFMAECRSRLTYLKGSACHGQTSEQIRL